VLRALKAGDRLALVAFSETARTALPLTEMTEEGQQQALEALEGLRPSGQTNIWGGLLASMEALRSGVAQAPRPGGGPGRLQATLLLTDGLPNVLPPRGHLAELRDYKDTHPDFSFQLNTFGFGYSLDSGLLLSLSMEGNGTYAFIPDAVIVGTTFVDSVANVLSTLSQSSTVNLMPRAGAKFLGPVSGGFGELEESWGRAISLGPLQHGQTRDLVVKMAVPAGAGQTYLDVVATYSTISGAPGRAVAEGASRAHTADAMVARARADAVSTGYEAISMAVKNQGKEAGGSIEKLCKRVEAAEAECAGDSRLAALKADVGGRMSKALKGKERFNRWGKHYLRALVRSHQLQVCTNFMDPGLQPYGGALFRTLREQGDKIFLSLPPPKPSARAAGTVCANTPAGQGSPSPNMTTYYAGPGGGCFAPSSRVTRITSEGLAHEAPIEDLRAGERVRVADGAPAVVRCVARIAREASKSLVAMPGGLRITPRHPVRIGGRWQLPREVPGAVSVLNEDGWVYNLLLDRCHVLLVDGVECVTWGHGLQGEVIGHAFFGSQRVVDALAALRGWEAGFVEVRGAFKDKCGEVVGLWGSAGGSEAISETPDTATGLQSFGGSVVGDEISGLNASEAEVAVAALAKISPVDTHSLAA